MVFEGEYVEDGLGELELELEEHLDDGRKILWTINLRDPPRDSSFDEEKAMPKVRIQERLPNGEVILWASDESGGIVKNARPSPGRRSRQKTAPSDRSYSKGKRKTNKSLSLKKSSSKSKKRKKERKS